MEYPNQSPALNPTTDPAQNTGSPSRKKQETETYLEIFNFPRHWYISWIYY